MSDRLRSFLAECKRVLKITRKPSRQEYMTLVKVTGIGLLLIGFVGGLISILYTIIFIR